MEIVLHRQLLEWRVVKGPHAFFGVNRGRSAHQKRGREKSKQAKCSWEHESPHEIGLRANRALPRNEQCGTQNSGTVCDSDET
jgi:hypothetical protein